MKNVVLISCVSQKKDHPAIARELYISTLFKLNLEFAKTFNPQKNVCLIGKIWFGTSRRDDSTVRSHTQQYEG